LDVAMPCTVMFAALSGSSTLYGLDLSNSYLARSVSDCLQSCKIPINYIKIDVVNHMDSNVVQKLCKFDVLVLDDEFEKLQNLLHLISHLRLAVPQEVRYHEKLPVILYFSKLATYPTTMQYISQRNLQWCVVVVTKPIGPIRFLKALNHTNSLVKNLRDNGLSPEPVSNGACHFPHFSRLHNGFDLAATASEEVKNVLIIEDRPVNQLILQHLLSKRGNVCYQVVSSCRSAVEIWKSGGYRLVFLNIHLQSENNDGLCAAKSIREIEFTRNQEGQEFKRTSIIAIVDSPSRELQEKALRAGCDIFLQNPLNLNTLSHNLDFWLSEC